MEAQGLIQCLDSFLRKVSEFLNDVLSAETLSAPASLKKLELIDNLDFIKFYHDPVSFIKCLIQKSGATDREQCKCRSRVFCVLPAACPRLLRARLDAFSTELLARLSAATVTTAAASLLVRRRDLVEPDLEGWLHRRLDGSSSSSSCVDDISGGVSGGKCYAVLCDTFLALFRASDDADEVAAPAIVVSDKYVLEEASSQGGSQFTVCGAGDRYTFACKSSDDAQKWIECLTRAARLRLQDLMDALKSPTTAAAVSMGAARASPCRGDIVRQPPLKQPQKEQTDRQRQPPEGAADEPSSAAAAAIGVPPGQWRPLSEAAPLRTEPASVMPSEALIAATPRPGAGGWSLDLSGFALPTRRLSTPKRSRVRDLSAQHRHSSVSSKSLSLHHSSTTVLHGSHHADDSPPRLPKSVSSDAVAPGRSPALWSVRDHLIKKPPAPLAGVRLRAKRATSSSAAAAMHRRVRSLVIENGEGSSSAASADSTSLSGGASSTAVARAARPRSVGARISQSASTLFANLAAGTRAAQPQQKQQALATTQPQLLSIPSAAMLLRPSSSDRAKALLGGGAVVDIEGCLHHRGLLKWSKLQCVVISGTLLGFKDSVSGSGGGGAQVDQPVLQLQLRGCSVVETASAADDSKAKRAHSFKLYPAAAAAGTSGAKSLQFAVDTADELDRWLAVLRCYAGPKTATLREPTSDLLSGVEQMVELSSEHGGSMAAITTGPQGSRTATDVTGVSTDDVSDPDSVATATANRTIAETADSHVDGGDSDADAQWPVIFSNDADLLDGLDFSVTGLGLSRPTVAAATTLLEQQQQQRQQQQQGITLPSSPANARSAGGIIIETDEENSSQRQVTTTAEVEFQPDAFVWLSPASSVRSARSWSSATTTSETTAAGDDPALASGEATWADSGALPGDDLQLRQMSLQRRQQVLQGVIREKERLQAVMLSQKNKYAKSARESSASGRCRRHLTSQLSSSSSERSTNQVSSTPLMKADERRVLQATTANGTSSPTGSKHRSSVDDIVALKQHMEGLKSKMRGIDRGLRQSMDPAMMMLAFHQENEDFFLPNEEHRISDANEETAAASDCTTAEKQELAEEAGTSDRRRLPSGHVQYAKVMQTAPDAVPKALKASEGTPTKSATAGTSLASMAATAASAPAAREDAAATSGPSLHTERNLLGDEASALTSWKDLRSLIDSLDAAESAASSEGLGHMIVLGDV